jgi:uncharacterized protein DUF1707
MPDTSRFEANDAPIGDREREQLELALRRHVADGRLDLPAFDIRVTQLYRAATRAQARAALAGLPPLEAPPVRRRGKRHGEAATPAPHWVATDEVFRDPSTGRVMRVWVDPTDGTRHYAEN